VFVDVAIIFLETITDAKSGTPIVEGSFTEEYPWTGIDGKLQRYSGQGVFNTDLTNDTGSQTIATNAKSSTRSNIPCQAFRYILQSKDPMIDTCQ